MADFAGGFGIVKIMKKYGHHKRVNSWQSWRIAAFCGVMFLCLSVLPAQALVVTIDLGWGYNATANTVLTDYNLQIGSIVQVVMYDSANASAPGTEADDNFDSYGDYGGPDLFAAPYTSGTENIPDVTGLYDPESVPSGHTLAYTTEIGAAINPNANGFDWYNIYEQFEILGTYDSLYIRVFGATEFPNGAVIASYWGLSGVETGTNIIDTWYVDPIDEVSATQTNYFEVIPEPGTVALLLLGAPALLAGYRRRSRQH